MNHPRPQTKPSFSATRHRLPTLKRRYFALSLLALSLPAFCQIRAQLSEPPPRQLNRISLSSHVGFNISATFEGKISLPSRSLPGPPTGNGIDRIYDDGFVRPDAAGHDGLTWFWGYNEASQLMGNDTLILNAYSSAQNAYSSKAGGAPQPGVELTYGRELWQMGPARLGVELAFNWTDLRIHDDRSTTHDLVNTRDTYFLGGVIAPLAPYSGNFLGPGPLITEAPLARETQNLPSGASLRNQSHLEADVFGFRLGPFMEFPLWRWLTFSLSGGVAVVGVSSDFSFHHAISLPASAPRSISGQDSHSDWLLGGYAEGKLIAPISHRFSVAAGVGYQNVGRFAHTIGDHAAKLDLGESIFLKCGLRYSF